MNLSLLHEYEECDESTFIANFGNKANGLRVANHLGLPVPKTWLVPTKMYDAFVKAHPHLTLDRFLPLAVAYIDTHLNLDLEDDAYAVRSSSNMEDGFVKSYAGVFDTCLNVPRSQLSLAIAKVWKSIASQKEAKIGVMIQPMIDAKLAGVSFSRHPSPQNVRQSDFAVIEYANTLGDAIVSGQIKPERLMGMENDLVSSEQKWVETLLKAQNKLKTKLDHEVDLEFAIDQRDHFWLLQQRPISSMRASHILDLTHYDRRYKRQLATLDIEMLIEGCARHLPHYLGLKFDITPWMVMTSNEMAQELWVEKEIDQAIVDEVRWNIETNPKYLKHIHAVYHQNHKKLLTHDYNAYIDGLEFDKWWQMMTPIAAHYYVPMFMLDALHATLLEGMRAIDPKHAKRDLYAIGTANTTSLFELFEEELRSKDDLEALSQKYGFLKCHQPYQEGYTAQELKQMKQSLKEKEEIDPSLRIELLCKKYAKMARADELFDAFIEWMRIRNQEMEYYLFACNRSRPFFEALAGKLNSSVKTLWNANREAIRHALDNQATLSHSSNQVTIYRHKGEMIISSEIEVRTPQHEAGGDLRGDVAYGAGQIDAVVKIAFTPEELAEIEDEPTVCVTGMTSPDFIPFMKGNIKALITDEGGILCHAAILAREMAIPTLVGTQHASEVLKNGMKVRINFNEGTIIPLTN